MSDQYGLRRKAIERYEQIADLDRQATFKVGLAVEAAPVAENDVVPLHYLDDRFDEFKNSLKRGKVHDSAAEFVGTADDVPILIGSTFVATATIPVTVTVTHGEATNNTLIQGVPYVVTADGIVGTPYGVEKGDQIMVAGESYVYNQRTVDLGGWERKIDRSDLEAFRSEMLSSRDDKESVKYLINHQVALTGTPDGFDAADVDGERVLLTGQDDPKENRIYVVNSSGEWSFGHDMLDGSSGTSVAVFINRGNEANDFYRQSINPAVVGTSDLSWSRWYSQKTAVEGSDSVTKTGEVLTVNPSSLEHGGAAVLAGERISLTFVPAEGSYVPTPDNVSTTVPAQAGSHFNGISNKFLDVDEELEELRSRRRVYHQKIPIGPAEIAAREVTLTPPAGYVIDDIEINTAQMIYLGLSSLNGGWFQLDAESGVASWPEEKFLHSKLEDGESIEVVYPVR